MDKPITMSVKDYLCRLLSIKRNISIQIIDAVVTSQFKQANTALKNNNSIELSGFGKFLFNHKKAYKKWQVALSKKQKFEELYNKSDTDEKKRSYSVKLKNTIDWMEQIKPKLERYEYDLTDMGRVEEQVTSSTGVEEFDRSNV